MKALKITGVAQLIEMQKDVRLIEYLLNCASGCIETIWLKDAVIAVDREAQQRGKPRNNLASLIAGTGIYGVAIVMGDGEEDVPEQYITSLLGLNDELRGES